MSNRGTTFEAHENRLLRERSGKVTTIDPLVNFLYGLLREHVPAGAVEDLVRNAETDQEEVDLTNGWLGAYAKDCANRLAGFVMAPTEERTELKVAYIQLAQGAVERTFELTPDVLLDYDNNDTLLGIELLKPFKLDIPS